MQVTAWWLVGLMDQLDDIDPLNGYDPAIGPPPSRGGPIAVSGRYPAGMAGRACYHQAAALILA